VRPRKPVAISLDRQNKSLEVSDARVPASEADRPIWDREEPTLVELMKMKIREALDDPRTPIPESEVFDRLERHYEKMIKGR
jgi:antitoxin ParD1/3/4